MDVFLLRTLAILSLLASFPWLPELAAQPASSSNSPSSLNALLQDYAYRALTRPKTGISYDATVPSNLTGITVSSLRLRSGSLFRRGANYEEFALPVGVSVTPYVERLILVYQNLGNWSTVYYPLPGFTYLAPVLGLIAYDALDLSAKNLPELDLRATGNPILIRFRNVDQIPPGTQAKCVWFDLNGAPSFSNVVAKNVCSTIQQGHFSIVVPSIAPSPAPVSPVPRGKRGKKRNKKVLIIVGSVLGGLVLLGLLAVLVIWGRKFRERKKMQQMERAAETGEALHMTPIGNTKAPAATVTRTQPVLESEYVP